MSHGQIIHWPSGTHPRSVIRDQKSRLPWASLPPRTLCTRRKEESKQTSPWNSSKHPGLFSILQCIGICLFQRHNKAQAFTEIYTTVQREELSESLFYSSFLPKSTNPELWFFMLFYYSNHFLTQLLINSQIMSSCHVRKKKTEKEGMEQKRKGLPKICSGPILFTHCSATFLLSNIALGLLSNFIFSLELY